WRYMSDRYVEKSFLYLLTLSVLLHLAIAGLIALLPPEKVKSASEPTMVELSDLPEPAATPPAPRPESHRAAEKQRRVVRETAPKGELEAPSKFTSKAEPPPLLRPARPNRAEPRVGRPVPSLPKEQASRPPELPAESPLQRGEGIFKPKSSEPVERAKLFPSAGKLARLEESYRKKYGPEVEEGDTKFLNTDDIQFG